MQRVNLYFLFHQIKLATVTLQLQEAKRLRESKGFVLLLLMYTAILTMLSEKKRTRQSRKVLWVVLSAERK